MIRPATYEDIPDLIEMAMMVLEDNQIEGMVVNRQKVSMAVRQCVQSRRNFSVVSEKDGVLAGALGAIVSPDIFHDGYQANILMWYGHQGLEMMKQFDEWFAQAPGLMMATYITEPGISTKVMARIMRKIGFDEGIAMFTKMRTEA